MSSPQSPMDEMLATTSEIGELYSANTHPNNWLAVSLSDVTTPSKVKAEPSQFAGRKYIGLEHIESGSNRIIGIGDIASVKSTKAVFRKGDVLYGKLRPYLKKVCKPDFDGVCSTDILVFPKVEQLDNSYLLYFLSQNTTADYATQNANGINLPRINSKTLGEIDFPLPPKAEQIRIVKKIESLQARSAKTRALLAEVKPLITQLRQSVLRSAFNGSLTADWRAKQHEASSNGSTQSGDAKHETASELLHRIRVERRERWEAAQLAAFKAKGKEPSKGWRDKYKEPEPVDETGLPELPEDWCWAPLELIATHQSGFAFKSKHFSDEGIQVIKLANLYQGQIDLSRGPAFLSPDHEDATSALVSDRDILVSQTGTRHKRDYGYFVRVPSGSPKLLLNQRVLAVRPIDWALTDWIVFASRTNFYRDFFFSTETGGVNQGNVGVSGIMRGPIPIASTVEMNEINRRLSECFNSASFTKKEVNVLDVSLSQLDQSILSKAFRGELVPQDPNDEPASELLVRVQAERNAVLGKKTPSKKLQSKTKISRSKKMNNSLNDLKEWIAAQRHNFSFEDIQNNSTADYESLKELLFNLLDDESPILEQVVDEKSKKINFKSTSR